MEYKIKFTKESARDLIIDIYGAFSRSENYFKNGDLPRNIRNTCFFQENVRTLRMLGANVTADGIYNDNGFDRIGYAVINGHVFVKNGQFNFKELQKAVYELAE